MNKKKSKKDEKPVIVLKNTLDGDNKVQMAKKLYVQLRTANLNLSELKLIDVYLSKINSHNPETKEVVFEKGELEKLFGVSRLRTENLDAYFNKLMSIGVIVTETEETEENIATTKKSFLLFDYAKLEYDKSDGLYKARMRCGDMASALIFNIEKIGFLQHTVKNTSRLQSLNSFLMYKFLEGRRNNRGKYPQSFEISLEELKVQLNCKDKYPEYKDFNNKVLKECREEILKITDVYYEYEPIKKGRRIVGIKFTLFSSKYEPIDVPLLEQSDAITDGGEQLTFEQDGDEVVIAPANQKYYYGNSYDMMNEMLSDEERKEQSAAEEEIIGKIAAVFENDFSPKEVEYIYKLIRDYFATNYYMLSYLEEVHRRFAKSSVVGGTIRKKYNYILKIIEDDVDNGRLLNYENDEKEKNRHLV